MRNVLGRLLRLALVLGLVPVALLVGGCKPACVGGSITLAAEDTDWGDLFKQDDSDKQQSGPKKPGLPPEGGGSKGKGGGGAKAKPCTGSGKSEGKPSKVFGANGPVIQSRTIGGGTVGKYKYRIDVENPAPGKRPGSLHVQLGGKGSKHYEYSDGGKFYAKDGDSLPNRLQKHLDSNPQAQADIAKGLKLLGER